MISLTALSILVVFNVLLRNLTGIVLYWDKPNVNFFSPVLFVSAAWSLRYSSTGSMAISLLVGVAPFFSLLLYKLVTDLAVTPLFSWLFPTDLLLLPNRRPWNNDGWLRFLALLRSNCSRGCCEWPRAARAFANAC